MFRLLKYLVILKLLNPFGKGFSLLRLLGCLVVAGGLLLHYGVPDWLGGMVRQALGPSTRTSRQSRDGGFGGREQTRGGLLDDLLADGEKEAGGILDNILKRNERTPPAPAPAGAGGVLTELLGKGGQAVENILAGAFGSGDKTPESHYGPPADFSGGTVTANPKLFAAFARHGLGANQLRSLPDSPMPAAQKPAAAEWQTVGSVVSGDTLAIGGQTVRLIGIDAPENIENEHLKNELDRIGAGGQSASMLHMGREAGDFVRRLAAGKRCWLEFDEGNRDQYGRVLAYVHLADGTNLNEAILFQGYAKAYLGANHRYLKRYIFLQDEAMRRGNGLWGAK